MTATCPNCGTTFEVRRQLVTDREHEVWRLIGDGLKNREIADRLCISERTVGNHISNLYDALNVRSRVQVALLYHKQQGESAA